MRFVYVLSDPRTTADRYVGETGNPSRRLGEHVSGDEVRTREWVAELRAIGLKPTMRVVERIDDNTRMRAQAFEHVWIRRLSAHGADLLNVSGVSKRYTPAIRV